MKKNINSAVQECIKVALRCRPISEEERNSGHKVIVDVVSERGEVSVKNTKSPGEQDKVFTFDMVFEPNCRQQTIFKQTTLPIIENVLEGYNGTIFAYGQTGTGKTHTMEGSKTNQSQQGIIPRTFSHLFKSIEGTPGTQFMVWCSMLELYNQQIIDLLKPNKKQKLNLHQDPNKGVYVDGLSQQLVNTVDQMKSWLTKGSDNRHTGSTQMNKTSSRSHSIFIIKVQMMELQGEKVKKARFNLVDLAGSERQKKTKASHDVQQQGIYINLALSTLGQVISALSKPNSKHIPYRDSKLTRLLQDSLGGNTKTVMIANIGPSHFNYDETISTLRYAYEAKKIKNKPKVNQNPKVTLIRGYQEEVKRLRELLEKGGPGTLLEKQKIVIVTPEAKLKAAKQKIIEEESKLLKDNEQERKRVHQSLQNYSSQRKNLIDTLSSKQKTIKQQQEEQQILKEKYKQMKQKLLMGNEQKQKLLLHEKQVNRKQQQLEQQRRQKIRLKQKQDQQNQEWDQQNQRTGTMKEIVDKRTKKLNDVISKLKKTKEQTNEIHQFRNAEREELEEQNRELVKELKFINLLIQNFIPISELVQLHKRVVFEQEIDDWIVKDIDGPALPNPGSAYNYKRPLCEFVRMAVSLGDDNPRYRPDNILKLDLDLPEITTEQFDGIQVSEKVTQTMNIALADDQEEQRMIANQKQPNVYIQNPQKMNKEQLLKQREQNKRAKSAKKMLRPGSGKKKKV